MYYYGLRNHGGLLDSRIGAIGVDSKMEKIGVRGAHPKAGLAQAKPIVLLGCFSVFVWEIGEAKIKP